MAKTPKRPTDTNQLAKLIVDLSTNQATVDLYGRKNPAAVELGRLGGLRGGKARAAKLSPERRAEIARMGVEARAAKRLLAQSSTSPSSGSRQKRPKKKHRAVIRVPED